LQETARTERLFAQEHNCLPLKPWKARWPLGLDMLANAFQYSRRKQVLQFFLDVVAESGTTFEQNLLGARGIDTIDPRNIEAILSTNFNGIYRLPATLAGLCAVCLDANSGRVSTPDYGLGLRAPTFRPLLGSGIFTQDGAAWRHSRQLLRPQFVSNRAQNFEEVRRCVEDLLAAVPADGVVDLQPLCFKLTFDTTMFLLFGDSVADDGWGRVAGQESEFAKAFNTAQDYLAHRGRLGGFYWVLNDAKFRNACATCHRFVDEAVAKALSTADARRSGKTGEKQGEDDAKTSYVFVEALAQQTRDPQVLRDQCLNVLLAGRDTTGCCLQWTLYVLRPRPLPPPGLASGSHIHILQPTARPPPSCPRSTTIRS